MPKSLLVDDSSTIQRVSRCLGSAYEYVEAEDGAEALESTQEPYSDLNIVDLHLPRMDGAEFLQRLRAAGDPRMARITVILLGGEGDFPESAGSRTRNELHTRARVSRLRVRAVFWNCWRFGSADLWHTAGPVGGSPAQVIDFGASQGAPNGR